MKRIALIYQKSLFPFIFEAAKEIGVEIALFHYPHEKPEHEYPAIIKQYSLDIFFDEGKALDFVIKKIKELDIKGVLTLRDEAIPFTSRVACQLNLQYIPYDVAINARDKAIMSKCFYENKVSAPKSSKISNIEQISSLHNILNFPVIVKPTSGFGSIGVIKAYNKEEVCEAFKKIQSINNSKLSNISHSCGSNYHGILLQEYIDGTECVVESFVHKGKIYNFTIGYKGNPKGPYFEESVYLAPYPLNKKVESNIYNQVTKAIKSLGITMGAVHTELRLKNNTPYIIEIGARIGGSGVSHVITNESIGINLAALCIYQCLGLDEKVQSILNKPKDDIYIAGNYIIPVRGGGVMKGINGIKNILSNPNTIRFVKLSKNGKQFLKYPNFSGFPGFVFSKHKNFKDGMKYHQMLDKKIYVQYE